MATKKIYTTGEVARLLGVNINTVIKWFDENRLEGFRFPGSNERRISTAGLYRFMAKNQMPADLLGEGDSPWQRKFRRILCNEPARLFVRNGEAYGPYDAVIQDLSRGGARIEVHGEKALMIPFGLFKLNVSVIDGPLGGAQWQGDIAYLQPKEENLGIGMRFAALNLEEENRLIQFVDQR